MVDNLSYFRRITINNLVELMIETSKLEYQIKSSQPRQTKHKHNGEGKIVILHVMNTLSLKN